MAVKIIPTLNPETFEIEYREIAVPDCPKCGAGMAHRTNKIGGMFWGCPNYPTCRSAMDMVGWEDDRIDLNSINQVLIEKLTKSHQPDNGKYGLITTDQDLYDKIKTWMKITGASNYGDLVVDLIKINENLGTQINNLINENNYLESMVNSPRIEEEQLKDQVAKLEAELVNQLQFRRSDDIDQRCDEDIDAILALHHERQERRKKNEQKMRKAFARNKAPKPDKSYWLKRATSQPLKKVEPSEIVTMADLGFFLAKAVGVTSLMAITVLCCEYVSRFF